MPPISELIKPPQREYGHTEPLASLKPGSNLPTEIPLQGFNVLLRCPIPAIGSANPDSLRQFYRAGLNQMRVLSK